MNAAPRICNQLLRLQYFEVMVGMLFCSAGRFSAAPPIVAESGHSPPSGHPEQRSGGDLLQFHSSSAWFFAQAPALSIHTTSPTWSPVNAVPLSSSYSISGLIPERKLFRKHPDWPPSSPLRPQAFQQGVAHCSDSPHEYAQVNQSK